MPSGESVGWLGCKRLESVPARPMVLTQWRTTRILLAASTKSRLDINLVTAATISAVRPLEMRAI